MVPGSQRLIDPVCVLCRKGESLVEQDFGTRTGAGRTLPRLPIASGLLIVHVSTEFYCILAPSYNR